MSEPSGEKSVSQQDIVEVVRECYEANLMDSGSEVAIRLLMRSGLALDDAGELIESERRAAGFS